ncbi:MAG: hypothetical protein K1X54_01345 [Flavobacteriales bacterium]|nr:hypothetical protein [Flavobacteriales bacterium]
MKLLITSFLISAFTVAQIDPDNQYEFVDFFRMAFSKSYVGLDQLRDPQSGKWQFETAVGDFDRCTIRYDLEKGVHVIDLIRFTETESAATQIMNRMAGQLAEAMPLEQFKRSDLSHSGKKEIHYIHKSTDASVRAKNPEVTLTTDSREGKNMLVISLYEPIQKTTGK